MEGERIGLLRGGMNLTFGGCHGSFSYQGRPAEPPLPA